MAQQTISAPVNPRPFGLPDPNAGATRSQPTPIGPNSYKKRVDEDPDNARKFSPNYPVEYAYPFPADGSRGLPTIKTGPSTLPYGHRVEGPVDYANVKGISLKPDPKLSGAGADPGHGSVINRNLAGGASLDLEGNPVLPFKRGSLAPPKIPPTPENPFGLPGPDTGPDLLRAVLGPE